MNRKKALWPLLLAAAFTLGVLAAQVQAATIFLPLVARASTGEETPTPPPPNTVMVQGVHAHWRDKEWYGELVNYTTCTVSARGVTMYLLDADGLPVGNATGYSMAPILLPGQRTPFRVSWYNHPGDWDSYVIYPKWDPIDRLTVESALHSSGKSGWWIVAATVRNQLPVRVESITLGIVVYGPSGEVIAYDERAESLGPLDPGQTVDVAHNFFWYDWADEDHPVACAAFAVPSAASWFSSLQQEPSPTPTPG